MGSWTANSSGAFLKEILAKLLAVWKNQIASVSSQTAEAITDLASRFSSLTMDLESAVSASRQSAEEASVDDDGRKRSIVDIFNDSETELRGVIDALRDAQQAKQAMLQEIREFSRFTKELAEMSEQVSNNARKINILSINARIEAARAGPHGEGFAVVAEEVRELSSISAATGKQITELVNNFNSSMTSVVKVTERNAAQDEESVSNSETTIRSVMSVFKTVTSSFSESASDLRNTGTRIQNEISDMLVSLQFQDRVSQILENVIKHMTTLHERIGNLGELDDQATEEALLDMEAWFHSIESTYTTDEQRQAHRGLSNGEAAQSQVAFF